MTTNSPKKLTTKKSLTPINRTQESITTANPSFKKFLDAGKNKNRVLTPLERYLITKPRDTSRSTTVLHPSEMVRDDWCHRASYFLLQGRTPAEEPASRRSLKTQLVFGEGHAIHHQWQSWFGDMGVLYGMWKCRKCPYSFWAQSPKECPICQHTQLDYREVPVSSSKHWISGNADGWIKGCGEDLLLEIKSVGEGTFRFEDKDLWYESGQNFETAWRNLKAPFLKHIMQVQVYLKLLEIMEKDGPQEAVLIYQAKPNQEVKEFIVRKSDFGIKELFDNALAIVDAIKSQTPPPCNVKGPSLCSKCEVYP